MSKTSAGLLMYKLKDSKLYVFIVHPGGPFWKDKDMGAWSIPKGEADNGEKTEDNLLKVAVREMKEETGIDSPKNEKSYFYLGKIKQKSGKVVHAWAFEGDWSGLLMCQSHVTIEYPYKSGKFIKFPEVDKAGFYTIEEAGKKLNPAQIQFLENLQDYLNSNPMKKE